MIVDKNKILIEWAYRTRDGKPNPKSMAHQIILEGVLKDFGWGIEEINELIRNLQEKRKPGEVWKTEKGWAGLKKGEERPQYGMKDKESADRYVAGEEEPEEKPKEDPKDDEEKPKEKPVGNPKEKNFDTLDDLNNLNSDEIKDRISKKDEPDVIPTSKTEDIIKRNKENRKSVFMGEVIGKGGTDTTAQEEMTNIGNEIAANNPNLTEEELAEKIAEQVCKEAPKSKYCTKKDSYKSLYKVSASGISTMNKVMDNHETYEYGEQPSGYPSGTTDTTAVRDILLTKLKECEGDKDCEAHYKEELYWFQKKATDKSVNGKEGDADTMLIYKDKDGRDRILYRTNKQTEDDQISNSTIESTKKSILNNVDERLNEKQVKNVTNIVEVQATEAKNFNSNYTNGVRDIATNKEDRAELEKDKDVIAKASSVDMGSSGRLEYMDPNKMDEKRRRKYAQEARKAPEVRAKLMGLPPAPNDDVKSKEYKKWKKEVNNQWKEKEGTFTDEQAIMASIDSTGTGNLGGVGSGSTGAPYSVIKMAEVTGNIRAKVQKCIDGGSDVKDCAEKVSRQTSKDGDPLYGGIFTADDIERIYNNKSLEKIEKASKQRGKDLEGMYKDTTSQLREEDQKYWDANQEEAKEAGYIKDENGRWVDNPDDDKSPENGPHERSYVDGYFERMHFDDYISGKVDGRVMAEMGDNAYEPKDIRYCLAKLTGWDMEKNPNPSGPELREHLLNRVRPDADNQHLIYVDKNNKKVVIGMDTHRTAGRGEKMSGQYGKDMSKCLKGLN